MFKRLKYWIAERFNNSPDYCWANLVMWVEGYRSFWSLLPNHPDNDYRDLFCKEDKEGSPYSYCGKCEATGKYYT